MKTFKCLVYALALSLCSIALAEEEETSAKVGPNQAILEADEHSGIKLSLEAIRNLELKTIRIKGAGPWEVPLSARLMTGEETNIYRLRDGSYKRIDFLERKRSDQTLWITSSDLKAGDEVVTEGVALLRISELAALSETKANTPTD